MTTITVGSSRVPAPIVAAGGAELQGWTGNVNQALERSPAARRLPAQPHVEQFLRKFVQSRLGDGSS